MYIRGPYCVVLMLFFFVFIICFLFFCVVTKGYSSSLLMVIDFNPATPHREGRKEMFYLTTH